MLLICTFSVQKIWYWVNIWYTLPRKTISPALNAPYLPVVRCTGLFCDLVDFIYHVSMSIVVFPGQLISMRLYWHSF